MNAARAKVAGALFRRRPAASPRPRVVQIVVTPGSGEGSALATARRLRAILARRGHEAAIKEFADLATLTRWATDAPPGFSHVVCVGGDATLSAAASAAIRWGTPFVPVPTGFGNVFAQVFGHSNQARAVVRLVEQGEVRYVDVGEVSSEAGNQVFLSHHSYGFLEQVQEMAERERQQPRRRLWRHLWYYGAAYRFLFRTPLAAFAVEIDGTRVADDAVLVTVANVETYRGFLTLTPQASPIDGLFDVYIVPRVSKTVLTARLVRLLLRLPGRWRGGALYRGRRVTVTTPRGQERVVVRRRALPLVVPPGAIEALRQRTVDDDAPPVEQP